MTYGQFLKQEGIEIGKKEGREEVAKTMLLKLGLDVDTVQRATELPKTALEKILQESR
jgi:hypothetical protein